MATAKLDPDRPCTKCGRSAPYVRFLTRSNGHRHSQCNECRYVQSDVWSKANKGQVDKSREATRSRRKLRGQALLNQARDMGCLYCGLKDHDCLEFHHRDPALKKFHVTDYYTSLTLLVEELAKCDVVCANCHKRLTKGRKLVPINGSGG